MSRRLGRRLALAIVVSGVVAQGAASAADPLRITSPVTLTKDDLSPSRLYLAPALAVDPANPMRVAAGITEMRTKACTFMRSNDGGQTWTAPDASPMPSDYPFCLTNNRGAFQGQLAWGRGGALYYAFPGWDHADGGPRGNSSVIVARSTDFGDSWQTVVARDNRGKLDLEQEFQRPIGSLAVDRTSGSADVVYVGYTTRLTGYTAPNAAPNITTTLVSRDAGRTWDDPIQLPATIFEDAAVRDQAFAARTTVAGPGPSTTAAAAGSRAATPNQVVNFGGFQPVVAVGKGVAYAIWPSTTANITGAMPAGIFLSRSTDQGRTWETNQALPFSYQNGTFVQMAWSEEGGSQGTLHVAFEYRERPEVASLGDIYYLRSTDGGRTWSDPRNVTDDPRERYVGQYYPNIAVAPNGRVDIAFYDTRNDPGYRSNDVYYTYSTDNGVTWSANERVSDRVIDRRIGVWSLNYDMTAPPGLASTDAFAILSWDDTRNTDTSHADSLALGGGLQDLMTANVQFTAVGGGTSSTAKALLAGVVGLVAVGLVLLVVAYGSRRAPGGGSGSRPARVSGRATASH